MEEYRSPISLRYTPTDGELIEICREKQTLLAMPETSWEHQTQNNNLIARAWGADRPVGNARRSLMVSVAVNAPSVATLICRIRHAELVANTQRKGTLLWQEGFVEGVAAYRVQWEALIMSCTARQLSQEEAPSSEPGAWGAIEWEIQLTNPKEL